MATEFLILHVLLLLPLHHQACSSSFLPSSFFFFYFIFKLYITVLVLPNIKMNPPQVYMCSPSRTPFPPPFPFLIKWLLFSTRCRVKTPRLCALPFSFIYAPHIQKVLLTQSLEYMPSVIKFLLNLLYNINHHCRLCLCSPLFSPCSHFWTLS